MASQSGLPSFTPWMGVLLATSRYCLLLYGLVELARFTQKTWQWL